MLRWFCVLFTVFIVVVSVVEYVWHKTPLQQAEALVGETDAAAAGSGVTVIRLGIASWQMREFPWARTIKRFEDAHQGRIHVVYSTIPEDAKNSMLLSWRFGRTEFDAIVAWADEEIFPFIDYNGDAANPDDRGLILNVRSDLTPEQVAAIHPAMWAGCSRKDPKTGRTLSYELPWMGEVLALNYNKKFFKLAGIDKVPTTWDEVAQACKKLKGLKYKGEEIYPLAMNFAQKGFFAQNSYIPMLASFKHGQGILDDKGRLDVSSPAAAKVFETLKAWYKAGYISPHAMVSEDVEKDLKSERTAMYPHWQSRGLWAVDALGADEIGIAPTPDAKEVGALVATYGVIIPKCSPVARKAAEICYEMFCTDKYGFQDGVCKGFTDPVTHQHTGGGKMPVLMSMYDDPDLPVGIARLGHGMTNGYSQPDPLNWQMVSEILVVEFQRYLDDEYPSAEAALAAVRRRLAEEVYKDAAD